LHILLKRWKIKSMQRNELKIRAENAGESSNRNGWDESLLMLIILIKLQTKMASERGTYMVSK
jgi:hypothetical protein